MLAEKQGLSIRPSGYYVSRNTTLAEVEEAEAEAEDAIFAQEDEEAEKSLKIEWTAKSGQEIKIVSRMDDHLRHYFEVSVNGRVRRLDLTDIEERDDITGIVATLGNIGLSRERYDKLLAMVEVPEDDEDLVEVCPRCHNTSCYGPAYCAAYKLDHGLRK